MPMNQKKALLSSHWTENLHASAHTAGLVECRGQTVLTPLDADNLAHHPSTALRNRQKHLLLHYLKHLRQLLHEPLYYCILSLGHLMESVERFFFFCLATEHQNAEESEGEGKTSREHVEALGSWWGWDQLRSFKSLMNRMCRIKRPTLQLLFAQGVTGRSSLLEVEEAGNRHFTGPLLGVAHWPGLMMWRSKCDRADCRTVEIGLRNSWRGQWFCRGCSETWKSDPCELNRLNFNPA